MEKMLVAQALDERDFLRDKIIDKINSLKGKLVVTVKASDTTTPTGVTIDEFKENAKSSYQSIKDLIKRYRDINLAINESNIKETVTVGDKTYTRAEAIALRSEYQSTKSIDKILNNLLISEASNGLARYTTTVDAFERHRRDFINSILGRDNSKDSDTNDLVKALEDFMIKGKPVLIDPLEITTKYDEISQEKTKFFKDLETAIKVSNATTFIEI